MYYGVITSYVYDSFDHTKIPFEQQEFVGGFLPVPQADLNIFSLNQISKISEKI